MSQNIEFENHLYQSTWQIIVQEGVRAFTIENLAHQMGVSKKTIYKYVSSKDDLIEKCINYTMAGFDEQMNAIIADEPNPILCFTAVIEFVSSFLSQIQTNRIYELKMRYPRMWKMLEDFRSGRRKYFHAILIDAQKQGFIKPTIDIDLFTILLMQMINGTFQPEFLVNINLDKSEIVKFFFRIITEGTLTEEGLKYVKAI